MDYAERLEKLVKVLEHGFTSKFERNCGLSNAYVSKKPSTPRMVTIDKIIRTYPQINREWLEQGVGEMFEELKTPEVNENEFSYLKKRILELEELRELYKADNERLKHEVSDLKIILDALRKRHG